MDWTAYVDNYCERIAPGLWGEPLNTVSNLAFLVAAMLIWRKARTAADPRLARTLAVLLGLIFLASTAFHALAQRWAAAADSGFILVFVLYYAVLFPRLFFGVRPRLAWLAAPAFIGFTALVTAVFSSIGFGSSYLAPLLGLFAFALLLAFARDHTLRPYWRSFALAGGVFTVSLSLRTADHSVCGSFPPGTHFLWHLLNACVLYLVSHTALSRAEQVRPRSPAANRA
ncbi:ceramidase domain-containing protein [Amycolatopsis aidingensis]|uniref:ceramidase domain-containing protein n=1 Tax=Amycolatopsis aidingensis TaxID=2842453 RepID=UPI001C0B202A|nr:ceramidase domain-containing protein [Amycolatopsis aidingensis]